MARGGVSRRSFLGASGAALSLGVLPRVARAAGPGPGSLTADVAVVGAGLAGLAAADALAARGASVLVLEASDRVGGRVLDMPIEGGAVAPLGAAWVHPSQRRVHDLAARAGLRLRTVKRRAGSDGLPAGVVPALRWLDAMAEHVDTAAAWSGGQAARRDTVNLAAWFADQAIDPAAGAQLSRLAEAVWGVPPAEVSLLQALVDVAAAGGAAALAELAIAPSRFVEGGAGRLVAHLAGGLGDRVLLSQPVQRVEHHPGGVRVVAGTVTVEAERVVVAVPPAVAAGIDFAPAIPAQRMLAQRLPMGSAATVACTYPVPLRTRRGAPLLESSALLDAVTVTPAGSGTWLARGEIRGSRARRWAALPDEERRSAVLDDLAARFASPASRPSSYVEHDWQADPWSAGGWAGVAPPGVLSGFGAALRQPVGPVHFAGAETASVWAGRLEGALESAERVAAEVLTAVRSEGAA